MTSYDHIYVPDELGFFGIRRFDDDTDAPIEVEDADKVECVIVLTIEELRELWHMGYNNGYTTCQMQIEPDLDAFKRYLTSKGITI
jgi:hypothetical protein